MTDTEKTSPLLDVPDDARVSDPTNTQRLRANLLKDSLAVALLAAWEAGDAAEATSRMLSALDAFHAPKQVDEHDSPTE